MSNIPIFLSSDNNYAPFVATTMASILDNTKSFVDFYILDGGISKDNEEKICELKKQFSNFSIEFLKINIDKVFSKIDYSSAQDYISISTYNRFLIPDLKPNIDKALYSDVDVIFMDDIKKMYEEKLHEYSLGAIWEEYSEDCGNNEKKERMEISKGHKFFSAGNLLIDCKKWRENEITNKLFNIVYKYNDRLVFHDMDVLNKYFDNNYKILSPKYCWINQDYEFYGQPKEQIVIRHFNGSVKPWQIAPELKENPKLTFTLDKNKFWHYAKMTSFYDMLIKQITYRTNVDLHKFLVFKLLQERKDANTR